MRKLFISTLILCVGFGYSQQDNTLTPEEEALGWQLLFDGTSASLEQWTLWGRDNENNDRAITGGGWSANNGYLEVDGSGSDIRSDRMYGDFVVTMDYRTTGNQGYMYRASLCGGSIWWSAIEVTIDNNTSSLNWTSTPGAAYSLFEPTENNFKGNNQINNLTILAIDDHVEHWHNGVKVIEFNFWDDEFETEFNKFWRDRGNDSKCFGRPYEPGGEPDQDTYVKAGYLGMQGNHGGVWGMKNYKVLEDPVVGCMDNTKQGYNPLATWDPPETACGPDSVVIANTPANNLAKTFDFISNKGSLNIETSDSEPYSITLLDIAGREIFVELGKTNRKLVIENLQQGLYFVNIKSREIEFTKRVAVF